jgi:hypothetical protein
MVQDLHQFARRMTLTARGIPVEVEKIVRKAAIVVDQTLVMGTPVDTGRARANWILSILAPATGVNVGLDETPEGGVTRGGPVGGAGAAAGDAAMVQARGVIAGYKLEFGTIFIVNNTEYIVPLNNGHSLQAPAGMLQRGLVAGAEFVKRQTVLKG